MLVNAQNCPSLSGPRPCSPAPVGAPGGRPGSCPPSLAGCGGGAGRGGRQEARGRGRRARQWELANTLLSHSLHTRVPEAWPRPRPPSSGNLEEGKTHRRSDGRQDAGGADHRCCVARRWVCELPAGERASLRARLSPLLSPPPLPGPPLPPSLDTREHQTAPHTQNGRQPDRRAGRRVQGPTWLSPLPPLSLRERAHAAAWAWPSRAVPLLNACFPRPYDRSRPRLCPPRPAPRPSRACAGRPCICSTCARARDRAHAPAPLDTHTPAPRLPPHISPLHE